jgi:hypothetical protein
VTVASLSRVLHIGGSMSKDAQIAKKIVEWSKGELETAREFAKNADPEQRALARQLARDAKRRYSKSNRRAAKARQLVKQHTDLHREPGIIKRLYARGQ